MSLTALALAAGLSGCAAPLPPTAAQLLNEDPSSQCLRALGNDPRVAVLIPRVGSVRTAGEATLPMLASKALPSAEERTALEYWGNERQRCSGLGQVYRAATMPAWLVAEIENGQQKLVLLTARLYAREINYGQFNAARQELAAPLRQGQVEFEQQRAADLARSGAGRDNGLPGYLQNPRAEQNWQPPYRY